MISEKQFVNSFFEQSPAMGKRMRQPSYRQARALHIPSNVVGNARKGNLFLKYWLNTEIKKSIFV
jgi:hypothetical protein